MKALMVEISVARLRSLEYNSIMCDLRGRMRFFLVLMLVLSAVANLRAQREPCLTGAESPDCGIKVVLNPPLQSADENIISVPNEITIDVPLRLHPTKVQLNSGPIETAGGEQFKLFAETGHYKKVGSLARFQLEINRCPGPNDGLVFSVLSPRLPYAIVVNSKPLECRQRGEQ